MSRTTNHGRVRVIWVLGFATALLADAVLFDGYNLWLGIPILIALGAMTWRTMNRLDG